MLFWDPTFILLVPVLLFAGWAQMKVKATFREFSHSTTSTGMSGNRAARTVLDANGLQDVAIEEIRGELTDHFDPRANVLRLSEPVYAGRSLAAVGVACHEAGHALQHAHRYAPLALRSAIIPVAQFGSIAAWPLFLMGFFFQFPALMDIGIMIFSAAALFQIITLPVELDASRRAIAALITHGIITAPEVPAARKVLNAAALTYLAGVVMALMQLVRLLILRSSRD